MNIFGDSKHGITERLLQANNIKGPNAPIFVLFNNSLITKT